jgi:Golgi nucleoside diphosphatase
MLKEAALIEVTLATVNTNITQYAIIIDAGSSGSRIFLYSWPVSLVTYIPLVNSVFDVHQPVTKKITPGKYKLFQV